MTRPRALLLDEPSAGLSPQAMELVFDKLAEVKRRGIAIVMVEQNARRALSLADRGYVLDMGRNAYEGTGRSLLDDPKVTELYLGVDDRVELHLDERALGDQPADVVRRVRRIDAGERLGVRTSGVLPVAIRRQQKTRAKDVLTRRAELGCGVERLLDRSLGLQKRVAGMQDSSLGERRRPADRDVRSRAAPRGSRRRLRRSRRRP